RDRRLGQTPRIVRPDRRGFSEGEGMTDTGRLRQALIERMLDGGGTASHSERLSEFENAGLAEPLRTLVQKVAVQAIAVTDGDIAAARASGFPRTRFRDRGMRGSGPIRAAI